MGPQLNVGTSAPEATSDFCGNDNAFIAVGNPPPPSDLDGSNVGLYGHFMGKKGNGGSASGGMVCGGMPGQSFFQFDGNNGKVFCVFFVRFLCDLLVDSSSFCRFSLHLVVTVEYPLKCRQGCHQLPIYRIPQHLASPWLVRSITKLHQMLLQGR